MNGISLTISRPTKTQILIKESFLILSMGLLLGISAPLAVPLPFSPVPIAIQAHIVLFLAAVFGSRKAFFMTLVFLAQGCAGLPVFAGGAFGIAHLFGPRGGYLFGYLAAALITGRILEKRSNESPLKIFQAMAMGNAVIYLLGSAYLSIFIPFKQAIILGVLPFIPGDLLKLIGFSKLAQRIKKKNLTGRRQFAQFCLLKNRK
ncbi:MAG: hypothetical protein Tsb0015_00570 [Simkaniaceae bacterium]